MGAGVGNVHAAYDRILPSSDTQSVNEPHDVVMELVGPLVFQKMLISYVPAAIVGATTTDGVGVGAVLT